MNLTRRLWLWGGGLALIVGSLALVAWGGYELRDVRADRDAWQAAAVSAVAARDAATAHAAAVHDSLLQLEQRLAMERERTTRAAAAVRRVVADPQATRTDVAGVALALADAADTLAARTLDVSALVPLAAPPPLPPVVLPPTPPPAALVDAERRGWWRGLRTGALGGALLTVVLVLAL